MNDVVTFFVGFAITWCVFFYFLTRSAPLRPRRGQAEPGSSTPTTPTAEPATFLANDPIAQRTTRPDTPRWGIPNSPHFVQSPDVRPFSSRCRIGTGGQGLTINDLAKENSSAASKSATL